jgi:hypothetical protein
MIMKDEKTTDNQLENLTVLVYSRLYIEHHEYVNSNSQCGIVLVKNAHLR